MDDIGPGTPVSTRRCPLCNGLLGVQQHGEGSAVEFRFLHTEDQCARQAATRIANLEAWRDSHLLELRDQDAKIRELGSWVGLMSTIIQASTAWIAMRDELRNRRGSITSSIETEELEIVLRKAVGHTSLKLGKVA